MAKAEWGAKRLCPKCQERFFDLNNDPATCPNCEHEFEIASLFQSDMRNSPAKEKAKAKAKPEADILDDDVDIIEDDPAIDDELLDDDDNDTVSLEEVADVPAESDE